MTPILDKRVLATLLGRPERELLTADDRKALGGQRVMITGAGGSIGSELARQLAACRPGRLTLVDSCELSLFQIEQELHALAPDVDVEPRLLDVTRGASVLAAFHGSRPHVVYHAAAYKHITMTERDVCAVVRTNVLGTWHIVRAARTVGSRMVLISSDKASQPASVMGATQRLAELITLTAATSLFRPVAVRLGDVLGSSGSLIPTMLERIHAGQPVEITDPNAQRFLMSAAEAASLALIADQIGTAGEIYWLDMGSRVRVGDLVTRLMTLTEAIGLPRVDVRVVGLRPGEKLTEELTSNGLELLRSGHRRIWVARHPGMDANVLTRVLRALRQDLRRSDALAALADLCAGVPEFRPSLAARQAAAQATMEAAADQYALCDAMIA